MNDIVAKEINIENMIYEIRGKQVMLDSDLAKLYQCKNGTKDINKAVRRNLGRFPDDFYFQISKDESLRFQSGTLNKSNNLRGQHYKYLPYVFTEQGVAMLASVLHTEIAEQTSINIMRAFVKMRKYLSSNLIEQQYINSMVLENHENIKLIQESLFKLEEKTKVNSIFLNGQIYDAYSKIVDIMNEAKNELIVIDRYADKNVLDMIGKVKCKVILICNGSLLKKMDIDKYNSQYDNLRIIYNDTFHDRFLFIDRSTLYHSGASINHAGFRTFAINKIEDNSIIDFILNKLDLGD